MIQAKKRAASAIRVENNYSEALKSFLRQQTLLSFPFLSLFFSHHIHPPLSRQKRRKDLHLLLLALASRSGSAALDHVRDVALAAVDAVKVLGHEGRRAALRAGLPEALDLAAVVDLEELEHSELDLAVLVLLLLGLGVRLLLALLASSEQREGAVERRVVGDAEERERGGVLGAAHGAAGERQALEAGGEACEVFSKISFFF